MIPKLGSALAKFLEPLKPVKKAGQAASAEKSQGDTSGGHGNLGAEKWKTGENPDGKKESPEEKPPESHPAPLSFQRYKASAEASKKEPQPENEQEPMDPSAAAQPMIAAQAGLTQVIVDIHSAKKDLQNGSGIQSYETGSREQKSGTRLPKGSMLDKKIG